MSMRHLHFCLFILLIGTFASLSNATIVRPFKFAEVADDAVSQEDEWNEMIKYKLFGTGSSSKYGVRFEGNCSISDTNGYVGSAKGNLEFGNTNHAVGGPLAFGRNFENESGTDTIVSGPSHFGGIFNTSNQNVSSNRFHGNLCADGGVVNSIETGTTLYGGGKVDCSAENIPSIDGNLDIPLLDTTVTYGPAVTKDGGVAYIDVPYASRSSDVYDLFIDGISLSNDAKLYVRMQAGGRLTRIFLKGALSMTNRSHIRVLQSDSIGDAWDETEKKWNTRAKPVTNKNYGGNLLIYTPQEISWTAGEKILQGTYISGSDLYIGQNAEFAGQLIAKSIRVDNGFRAKDFRYVPFDAPVINASGKLYESHEKDGDTVKITLTAPPATDVPFKYCFEFNSPRNPADASDLVEENSIPICSKNQSVTTKFKRGESLIPVVLHAVDDRVPEASDGVEYFKIYIFDLEAAVYNGIRDDNNALSYSLSIIDGPSMTDLEFSIKENSKAKDTLGTVIILKNTSSYNFKIADESGLFDVNEKSTIYVKADSTINYEARDMYVVKVYLYDGNVLKDSSLVQINVIDVNDPPSIRDSSYWIFENAAADTSVGVLNLFDEDGASIFRNNKYSLVGGDSAYFSIDAATGMIKAKKSFDYESLPADQKFFVLDVKVVDDDDYSSTASVKIEIRDVIETSEIVVTLVESDNGDTKVEKPTGTVNMNVNAGVISWTADGKTMPDTVLTNLREGKNVVTLYYMDSTKNEPVTKDVVIFVCTKTPEVTLSTDSNNVKASNIYTVVEKIADDDTTFYVNKSKKELVIEVKEPILDSTYTDSTCNYKTTPVKVTIDLDTVKTPSAALKDLGSVASTKIALDESRAGAIHTLYNDSLILVSYKDKVDGKEVTVSYLTNSKGDMIEDNFKVSYETTVDGKTVTVSYEADAATGEPVKNKEGVVFEVSYTKDDVTVAYQVDASGKVIKDDTGNVGYNVTFSYTSEFGNKASKSIYVVVDEIKPKVEIKSPVNDQVIHSNMVEVEWYVDYGDGNGPQLQTELVTQGLTKGPNVIVRYYMDKAGNADADTVFVIMKDAKDVDISVVTPVTIITQEKVDEYYAANELKKGQTYAVTIYNSKTDKEVETLTGGSYKAKEGSGEEPYPGLEGHLGPTLAVDVKVPSINAVGGMATLDDMMDENGMVLLEDVDAGGKATVDEYIQQYCSADFATAYASDPSRANLYDTKMKVEIWVFTSLGSFVDYFTFTQEMNNPDYANDAGLLTMYFEQKPDKDGNVRTKDGRLYGTGAYVYKTVVTMKSKLQCTLYPESEAPQKMGMVRKVSDDLLKPFGYKRPEEK